MERFISPVQLHLIRHQLKILLNGYTQSADSEVRETLRASVMAKVETALPNLTNEQREILLPMMQIKDTDRADQFTEELKTYVVPFPEVTEKTLKKLFPKAKKLKLPETEEIDWKDTAYMGWDDKGTGRKFLIANNENKLEGIFGTFSPSSKKGICAVCSRFAEVGMFMSEAKGTVKDTFIKRGNYICRDSTACSLHVTHEEKLQDFISRMKAK